MVFFRVSVFLKFYERENDVHVYIYAIVSRWFLYIY